MCESKMQAVSIRYRNDDSTSIFPAVQFYSTIILDGYRLTALLEEARYLFKDVDVRQPMTNIYLPRFLGFNMIFIQTYQHGRERLRSHYHLIAIAMRSIEQPYNPNPIMAEVSTSNRCPHISELFNASVMAYVYLKRFKFYQLPCTENKNLRCFYDENYMCICDRNSTADCFMFDHDGGKCTGANRCENEAICVQDNVKNPLNYACICPGEL